MFTYKITFQVKDSILQGQVRLRYYIMLFFNRLIPDKISSSKYQIVNAHHDCMKVKHSPSTNNDQDINDKLRNETSLAKY
jgi:hypothetical protein